MEGSRVDASQHPYAREPSLAVGEPSCTEAPAHFRDTAPEEKYREQEFNSVPFCCEFQWLNVA